VSETQAFIIKMQ